MNTDEKLNTDENLNALRDSFGGTPICASCGCRILGFLAMNWKNEWYCHYCWQRAERLEKRAKVAKTASKAPSDGRVSAPPTPSAPAPSKPRDGWVLESAIGSRHTIIYPSLDYAKKAVGVFEKLVQFREVLNGQDDELREGGQFKTEDVKP